MDTSTQAAELVLDATAPAPSADETESIYAWSHADDDTLVIQRRSWKLPLAAALLAVSAVATVGVAKVWPHHSTPGSPTTQVVTHSTPPAQAAELQLAPQPSPPAEKINPDQRFVSLLTAQGFVASGTDGQVAQAGHEVCTSMGNGYTLQQVINGIANGSGVTTAHATRFAETAIDVLCPQYEN